MITVSQIDNLIGEEKIIIIPPKKEFKIENQHTRNDFELSSKDEKRKYSVFIRCHVEFKENFSIGLIYYPEDGGSIALLRCNGNHGEVVENILIPKPHFGYHLHKVTINEFENKKTDPKFSEETKEYASYEQALAFFCKYVNIKDAEIYFPGIKQINLFDS
jgi:hypothetical protein